MQHKSNSYKRYSGVTLKFNELKNSWIFFLNKNMKEQKKRTNKRKKNMYELKLNLRLSQVDIVIDWVLWTIFFLWKQFLEQLARNCWGKKTAKIN